MNELTGAIHSLANGKTVDGVFVEMFKITLNDDPVLCLRLLDVVVVFEGGRGAAAIEIYHHHGTP